MLSEVNISGKLADERFMKLTHVYEREQKEQQTMRGILRRELKEQEQQRTNVKSFIATTKKYTDLTKLDATVLREFIEKVYVSEKDKQNDTRGIRIVYNFIGEFDFDTAIKQAK